MGDLPNSAAEADVLAQQRSTAQVVLHERWQVMATTPTTDMLAELRKIDTPTITNAVATYPNNPLCPAWTTPGAKTGTPIPRSAASIREMGAVIGHAVTCVYGLPDPNFTDRPKVSWTWSMRWMR